MRHFGDEVKPTFRYMRLHCTHPDIAGAASRKQIAECKWAEIEREVWCHIRETHVVLKHKVRSPIHVHIVNATQKSRFRIGGHQYELFFREQIDFQPGRCWGAYMIARSTIPDAT